jgi:outer membrane protein assembly factor BamE
MINKRLLIIAFMLITTLTGCSSVLPDAYRIDIPQGNLLHEEQIQAVKIGMNQRQVQNLLGSPLLTDTFNQNRWDYFYSINTKSGTTIKHHVTVTFKKGIVSEITSH